MGKNWNEIIPTKDDLSLQVNTILHSEAVVNLGSSMVFDFAIFDKPCLFLNYNVETKQNENWSTEKIYNFVHFRSMPTGNEVMWIKSKEELQPKLESALQNATEIVEKANLWFQKINHTPTVNASER